MFAVVDVETTGGYASGHRMTEIAIVIHDGLKIVEEFSTLLNPQQPIPLSIQTLTGITPEMVENAPLFEEVAEEVMELLGNHIFVAHNVNFDYAFVRSALAECGYNYNPRRLCSVRYCRKIEKDLPSYSLKNLCRYFKVKNEAAHRAWGDARATAQILGHLLEKDIKAQWQYLIKKNAGEFNLPAHLPSEDYHCLPEKPGVYYFYDKNNRPIYIGKARNLKKRVASHFISDKETRRSQAFKREIYHLDYKLTGSELLASLLEDHEIRHFWPRFNLAQKNPKKRFGVFAYRNQREEWSMAVNRISGQNGYLAEFFSYHQALDWVYSKMSEYRLNPHLCCFPGSANISAEEDHQKNFERMLSDLKIQAESFLIKTPGRESNEDGFAYIDKGKFAGIGFVSRSVEISSGEEVLNHLQNLNNSITTQSIITKVVMNGTYPTIALQAV